MSSVAIVIPIYKNEISDFERISLQQCYTILGSYEIKFICPNKMKNGSFHKLYKKKGIFIFLENENFCSITQYNHLLLSVSFYQLFTTYTYILIYQLDCFVFKDELQFWINKRYSYIGAPWFNGNSNHDEVNDFMGVGNGGFSLRNINDCIAVLKSSKKIFGLKQCISQSKPKKKPLNFLRGIKQYIKIDTFKTIHTNTIVNEDKIFSLAGKRFKFFNIPMPRESIPFSFEMQPKKLYRLNNNQLPFGCHAWWKYDLNFYIPFFETYGYKIKQTSQSNLKNNGNE